MEECTNRTKSRKAPHITDLEFPGFSQKLQNKAFSDKPNSVDPSDLIM